MNYFLQQKPIDNSIAAGRTQTFTALEQALNYGIASGIDFRIVDDNKNLIYSSYPLNENTDTRSFLQD
jgi:hypothetical protein